VVGDVFAYAIGDNKPAHKAEHERGLLTGMTNPDGSFQSYTYYQAKLAKIINEAPTFFYWDNWNLIEERDASGTESARYIHGGQVDEILSETSSGTTVYYHHDALGNVTVFADMEKRNSSKERCGYFGRTLKTGMTRTGSAMIALIWKACAQGRRTPCG